MIDLRALWDFDDPAGSEQRLRAAADQSAESDRDVLVTQVARALGLQGRYAEAHQVLDGLESFGAEVSARRALERGRLLRSSGDPQGGAPQFFRAAEVARDAGLDEVRVDAMHMLALVAPPADQVRLGREALAAARASRDPRARDWDAPLLHNIGMTQAESGDHEAALASFEAALAARERQGEPGAVRVARWMVAWSLRHLGRRDEALTIQLALRVELEAAGERDTYVDEELRLLEK